MERRIDSFVLSPLTVDRSSGLEETPTDCAVAGGARLPSATAERAVARMTTALRICVFLVGGVGLYLWRLT